ncbi:hypothetical protein BZG36_04920 [Bifiguratus adelaidae]|uniref:Haloacid dehalogenase, type II n=1 Tax=Bifiguratus adelaidae TaxID=1938954 RepID=A0A261XX04_9FUNG|nr:hypothetical protein BZG36_04920 [Bifiguratus adelaidae]
MDCKAYVFDVIGTLTDWRTGLREAFEEVLVRHGDAGKVDADAFAVEWHEEYMKGVRQVAATAQPGEPYMNLDVLLRHILTTIVLPRVGYTERLSETEIDALVYGWHNFKAHPEVPAQLRRWRAKDGPYLAPLSNSNIKMLVDTCRHADLQFDLLTSSESFASYKPSPSVYLGAAKFMAVEPHVTCLVAAHYYDIKAAKKCGFKTVYLWRQGRSRGIGG